MKLRIWGCRGSLPVPGQTTLKYGGNTTCLELRLDDGTVIVIDAGSGIRNLGKKLIGEKGLRDIYLLLTHSHWDHLMGFPFFAPAYSEQYSIHVRGGPIAKEMLKQSLEHQMEPPYFPARMNEMKADFDITHGIPIIKRIGSAEITSIPLNHPNGGFGYALREYDKSIVFLTDNELNYQHRGGKTYSEYVSFCRAYYDAVHLALDARVKHLMFFHHDPDRTDVELDQIITQYNDVLNKMKSKIQLSAAIEGEEISGLCP
jgi:phosphoribosyl 1,2-cyclic phosphodiesterase